MSEALESRLLRDIYPNSFLNDAYLAAPVGKSGTGLREWIEARPGERGELRPFTEELTEWTPPIERIPQIREELYRGGRVFHWRFFCPTQQGQTRDANGHPLPADDPRRWIPEPLYRADLAEPWEAPAEIHEIFTAEYYKDKDPGLIY